MSFCSYTNLYVELVGHSRTTVWNMEKEGNEKRIM
jgi:hypothetical protein